MGAIRQSAEFPSFPSSRAFRTFPSFRVFRVSPSFRPFRPFRVFRVFRGSVRQAQPAPSQRRTPHPPPPGLPLSRPPGRPGADAALVDGPYTLSQNTKDAASSSVASRVPHLSSRPGRCRPSQGRGAGIAAPAIPLLASPGGRDEGHRAAPALYPSSRPGRCRPRNSVASRAPYPSSRPGRYRPGRYRPGRDGGYRAGDALVEERGRPRRWALQGILQRILQDPACTGRPGAGAAPVEERALGPRRWACTLL